MSTANNTFNKGLNLDTPNYQYQPDTLSYCRNCDYLTGEGNEAILQNIKGNTKIDGLKENYFPVAIKSYGGVAYIVSAEVINNTFTGRGEVGSFPSPDYSNLSLVNGRTLRGTIDYENPRYSPLKNYLDESLEPDDPIVLNEELLIYGTSASVYKDFNTSLFNFTEFTEFDIEIQPSYDGSINIIFTDNYNPIRLVNTRFTALSNNTVEIRDRIGQADTNLYNKYNFNNTLNLFQNSTKIVNLDLDSIGFGGELNSGIYRYYIKYATQDGNVTNIIAESFNVNIFHGTTLVDARGGDDNLLRNTRKSVRLKLSNLDMSYKMLKVQYSYSYGDNNIETEFYEIEDSFNITNNSITIQHTGRESIFPISRQELGIDYVTAFTGKSLTQVNNKLYIANIKSKQYNLVAFEEFANNIKVGHKQKKVEVPFTSAIVDDNSIYSSLLTTKIANTNDSLSIGYKNGYHNPFNTYYFVGYTPGEKYLYSCRFILDDGTTSQCFPLRGIDNWENDKYITYGNETLNEANDYFSTNNGENLKGLYRFPQRTSNNLFAQRNGDTSYSIIDSDTNIEREVDSIGDGSLTTDESAFIFSDSITDINTQTLEDYYFNELNGGSSIIVTEETLENYENPNYENPNSGDFFFDYSIFDINDCISNPDCELTQEVIDCINDINCTVSLLRHNCEFISTTAGTAFPAGQLYEISGVTCSGDQFNNTTSTITLTYQNQVDSYGNPLGTTYDYQVISTKEAQANILAVTFELPNTPYPEGTIGVQFMRSIENSKDSIGQGYIVDTLPVPSIEIYGKEERGNRYIDYISDFGDGGMKLVPSIDYVLESPAVWDRRGLGPNRKKIREDEGGNTGLQPVLFNNKGWKATEPYEERTKFAFISNDLLSNPVELSSTLIGGNFKLKEISKIGLFTGVRTSNRSSGRNIGVEGFSVYKTITVESSTERLINCELDFVLADVEGRTPNGFSSRCQFSGTHNDFKYESFVMFPLKFNSYIGVSTEDTITLGEFSNNTSGDRLGENLHVEPNYGGDDNPSFGVIRPVAMLVNLYRDLGFDLGTNVDDLNRIKSDVNLAAISYTPVTKRLYWIKPEDELDSVDILDVSEDGKIVAYQGDNFVSLGIRQLYNNIYGVNDEAPENSFRSGRVGYSLTLVNDSIYNPLFRTIEIPNQAEPALNFFPNLLTTSPNNLGNKYAQGNQWRDYEELESTAFNFGGVKTYTDRNYITLVDRVPFLNTEFSTRVIYSELHINSAIENGYRNFLPSAYRDYSQEMGAITAIRSFPNNNNYLVLVQENGIGLVPVVQRDLLADTSSSTSGSLYFDEAGILGDIDKVQQLTKQYGSKWLNSIVTTNTSIYGVDIENTKVWKLNPGLELISDYKIQSWLRLIKPTYSYKSVNLLNRYIYGYYNLGSNYVHFNYKDVVCSSSVQDDTPYAWQVDYSILEEYNNGILTGQEKPNVISDPDYIEPAVLEQIESPCPIQGEPSFPNNIDIYVVWDTTSFNPTLKATLQQNVIGPWIQNFRTQYPQWIGNFQQIDAPNTTEGEQWLSYVNLIPNTATKVVLICMIDEAHTSYHNQSVTRWDSIADANNLFNVALSTSGTTQPTAQYITDYNNFITIYNTRFDYFKGMVYAIPSAPSVLPRLFANLQLHAYCAIEGTTVSPGEFVPSQQGDISIIQSENLYSTIGPGLKNFGWQEQHNFSGQASDLTLEQFTEDINPLIIESPTEGFSGWKPRVSSATCTPLYKLICVETTPVLTQNISYSETLGYWNSFWGFFPSKTFNLYNKHYSFNGSLTSPINEIWEHNTNNTRCNFYGYQDEFVFEFVITSEIQFQKIFTNFILLCNEVPPIFIEYTTDNEPTIDDVKPNPIKEPRVQTIYPRFRQRYYSSYNPSNPNPVLNRVIKYNAKYKENHMYIQIDDNNRDTKGRVHPSPFTKLNNAKIRDKYLKVRFRYKGDEYSIIQAVITAYQISFS